MQSKKTSVRTEEQEKYLVHQTSQNTLQDFTVLFRSRGEGKTQTV